VIARKGGIMSRFAILRDVPSDLTRADIDATAVQQIFNLAAVSVPADVAWESRISDESQLSWVRSYWHEGTRWGLCLYTARTKEELELYQLQCDVPFVEVTEVTEFASPETTDGEKQRTATPERSVLLGVEHPVPGAGEVDAPMFADLTAWLGESAGQADLEGIRWVRTYWDGVRRSAVSLYAAPGRESADAATLLLRRAGVVVHEVTEIYPEDYIEA
jgi:hypothetical protein